MCRKNVFFLILGLFIISQTTAQRKKEQTPAKPKLIIGIIVEQMRYDFLYRYWRKLDDNGFKRLINYGANCKNTFYPYLFSQSGVGQATIATGTVPANHGIISQYWYNQLTKKMIYCVHDAHAMQIGGNTNRRGKSARHLLATTIGDELQLFTNFESKVFGISLSDCAAILASGHTANAAFWFDENTGNWISSNYYIHELPNWVNRFNNKKLPDIYLNRNWNTMFQMERYTESLPDANIHESGFGGLIRTFPYDLKKMTEYVGDYSILPKTPFGNSLIKDFTIATIVNEKLGSDYYTDLLMVTFSATGNIGDMYGINSKEIQDTYLRLDRNIAELLQFLDNRVGKKQYLFFLTSDHGASYPPSFLKDMKMQGGYFQANSARSLLDSYLRAIYGEGRWVTAYYEQQFFLNHELIEEKKINLAEIQLKAAQFIVQFTGVSDALTATTLQNTDFKGNKFEKMQNSFHPKISGDVLISLLPGWCEKSSEIDDHAVISHNSFYSYDTHVPLIWYGWKIKPQIISRQISMEDIAPTIATFLNMSQPNACSGTFINEFNYALHNSGF